MFGKPLSLASIVLMLLFALTCRAGDKYEEAREVYEEYVPAMEKYLDAVDKTENPQDLAKAINTFANRMEVLAPKIKRLNEKYPELANDQAAPQEYADLDKKSEALGARFAQSFTRIMPYMEDPQVMAANERLTGIMETMGAE